jgi:hypothetical protein
MKTLTGLLLAALLCAAIGALSVAVWRIEGHLADVHEQTATLQFERAQRSLDAASELLGYADWVPLLGDELRGEIRMRQALLQYWQRNYDALVPQSANPAAAEDEPAVDLQLVFANAGYRAGQARATNRATALRALEEAVSGYAAVLRNTTWHPDAAFNYEYAARLRDDMSKGRRATAPQREGADFGLQGEPAGTTRDRFEIYIPLDNGESRPVGGDAGKAPPGARKG